MLYAQEREIRAVFDALDQEQSGEISYDDVQRCMELISDRGGISPDQIFKATECIWTVLDTNKVSIVSALLSFECVHSTVLIRSWL